jgi:hypothetical protein
LQDLIARTRDGITRSDADTDRVSVRPLLAMLLGVLAVLALVGASATATAGSTACASGNGGYTYAGSQSTVIGHGVRATITATRAPDVAAGHVAGWVGVGGPKQGPNGEDEWIQAGIASLPGLDPLLYTEITRAGRTPEFRVLEQPVPVGESRQVTVLEMGRRPGWWRVWVDGQPVTQPIRLRGSSGRWAPIATAESWDGGVSSCNRFAYRFEGVAVSRGGGGSWRPYVPGYRFLDRGYHVHALTSMRTASKTDARRLTEGGPDPYAFVAASS